MEHYQNTLGIVIKTTVLKESDIFVTLLTPQLGKIVCLAKGAKNIKSSRLGSLQLGNIIKAHLYRKNDFLWLSESTTVSQFLRDHKNLTQLNLLFYFLEILNHFIAENQQIDGVYQIVEKLITSINNNQLAHFIKNEINFIEVLGFGMPQEIVDAYNQKKYIACQKLIKQFLESIIDKPLQSSKLFT
jgi:DNA repair protein RecO